VAALLMLALLAHRQVGFWRDSVTLWSHTVQVTRDNYQAEDNLAAALMDEGKYQKALPHLHAAEAIYPFYPLTNFHEGVCEQELGNLPLAIEQYRRVIELTDGDVVHNARVRYKAFQNMGTAYHDLGDIAHAMESVEAAQDLRRHYVW
jgi:tetratricopeptide (TPR) repeat protein